MKFLGGARVLDEQAGFYHDEKEGKGGVLLLVLSRVYPGDEEPEILKVEKYPLVNALFQFSNVNDGKPIMKWLESVITGEIPTVEQRRNLEFITYYPDSPITQACINVCMSSDCLCPLAHSIGCLEFIEKPIQPKMSGNKVWNVSPMAQKKCITRAIAGLRRFMSYDDLTAWLRQIRGEELVIEGVVT